MQIISSASKSKLLKIIEPIGGGESSNKEGIKYFIDGGMLVHPIQWKIGSSFQNICSSYASFLSQYPSSTVIFGGYNHSTKDMIHKSRSKNLNCTNIFPTLSSFLTVKKRTIKHFQQITLAFPVKMHMLMPMF